MGVAAIAYLAVLGSIFLVKAIGCCLYWGTMD